MLPARTGDKQHDDQSQEPSSAPQPVRAFHGSQTPQLTFAQASLVLAQLMPQRPKVDRWRTKVT